MSLIELTGVPGVTQGRVYIHRMRVGSENKTTALNFQRLYSMGSGEKRASVGHIKITKVKKIETLQEF